LPATRATPRDHVSFTRRTDRPTLDKFRNGECLSARLLPAFRMVENIFEELDVPGECFHNAQTNTLYFKPQAGADLSKASVEVVELAHLIELQGSLEKPVRFIQFQGFTFRHTARTFMNTREPLLRSDWAIYRGGAVMLTGTEVIHVLDSTFDQPGGNALFVNHYNRRTLIKGCHIHEGYGRKAYNNVLINNGFHPHVWYEDCASEFQRNIVMIKHAPIGMKKNWGVLVDYNFFTSEADRAPQADSGSDAHSLSGDPMFVDAASGDFRVKDGSPALKTGFKNFPMDHYGVKKPALKAIAKTPVIPALLTSATPVADPKSQAALKWLGAAIRSLQGEEFSAFGVSKEDGGVQLVRVPEKSDATRAGLQDNDLVQQVNDIKVSNTDQFFAALKNAGEAPIKLRVIRNQQAIEITLQGGPKR
jgi:hypothetical protein